MTNPQKKSGAQPPSAPEPESRAADPGNLTRRFEQAYHDYLTALKDAQVESHKRLLQAHRDYSSAMQNSWVDAQKRLNDLNHGYVAQVQDAWGNENAQNLVNDAYRNYVRTARETYDDVQKRCQDEHERHSQPVQELGEDTRNRLEQAYRDYVSAIKDAWASADPKTIDVNTLAAISNSLAAASWFALSTGSQRSAE